MHTRVACQRVNDGPAQPPAATATTTHTMHTAARTTIALLAALSPTAHAQPTPDPPAPAVAPKAAPQPLPTYTLTTPVSRYQLNFVRIPARIERVDRPGRSRTRGERPEVEAAKQVVVSSFYLSTTEVTWDCLDPFVYRLDLENPDAEVDANTRPSKPYIPPDRGFGHEGYPAISITFRTAQAYCEWLSEKTGLTFRLPTDAEWEHAAAAGAESDLTRDQIDALAWHKGNAQAQTHPVKSRPPNAWGLYDMLGNAGEWTVAHDNTPRLRGGSFTTPLEQLNLSLSEKQAPSWNASDPQIPKSKWWLPDAPFAGFRIVLECDPKTGEPLKLEQK
jgi:formylglycine-generating enzyme required for sulfatase activity